MAEKILAKFLKITNLNLFLTFTHRVLAQNIRNRLLFKHFFCLDLKIKHDPYNSKKHAENVAAEE